MTLFTLEEIEAAFDEMVANKIKNERKSIALEFADYQITGQNTSVLPVGHDGITTMHVLKTPQSKSYFLNEIFRLINECIPNTDMPRIELKKYKIKDKSTDETKTRKIVIPCLRDQVVVRCILNKLNDIGIIDEKNKPNQNVHDLTRKIRKSILTGSPKKIIRTDIKNFYPSINSKKLIKCLEASHGNVIDPRIMNLIRKILIDNKSKDGYTGLPLGVGFCVLLANYYISQMNLSQKFSDIEFYRYEDDVLFIVDANIEEELVLNRLDAIYAQFGIERNTEKTETVDGLSEFRFVGVSYKNGKVFIGEEKFNKWKLTVADDIKKQFKDITMLKKLSPDTKIPTNKQLVTKIWKAHKKGLRSKTYQNSLRLQMMNEEVI